MFAATTFVGCLLGFSWLGWQLAKRWLEESHPRSETSILVLASYVIGVSAVVIVTFALGALGLLLRLPFLILTLLLLVAVLYATRNDGRLRSEATRPDKGIGIAVVIGVAVVAVDLALSFGLAPNNWDAMTYHLYLPARWLQEGALFHVPTVFGDNAAAFAPQNGALLFATSMLLLGSDAATNALQALALGASAVGVYYLARRLEAQPVAASLAGTSVFFITPLRDQAFSANVDAFMVSFFVAAVALLVHYSRRGNLSSIHVAGLAVGLVAGTKTIGLTLALLLCAVAIGSILVRRHYWHLLGFLTLVFVGGGFWYTNNWLHYGNPIFPLDVSLGPLHFAGAYDIEAVRAGEFHFDSAGQVLRHTYEIYGLPILLLVALGALGIATRLRRRTTPSMVLLGLALTWSLWFIFYVPHNNQARFLVPALLVLLPGIGVLLDWLSRKNQTLGWGIGLVMTALLFGSSQPITRWREAIDTFASAHVTFEPVLFLTTLSLGSWLSAWFMLRRGAGARLVQLSAAVAAISLVLSSFVATTANEDSRIERIKRSEFSGWGESALWLHDPEAPAATIAYSGANVPYILTGRRFRHRVVYVNTRGGPSDGFYEHWLHQGRKTYEYHKPGLYRADDDLEVWLDNLETENPSALFLFTLHPSERQYLLHTPDGFPPESVWASSRPDIFELTLSGEFTQMFEVQAD